MLMLEQLHTLRRMQQVEFSPELAKEYPLELLNEGCGRMEEVAFDHEPLMVFTRIQSAIICQPNFLTHYRELADGGVSNAQIEEWLRIEVETGCRLEEQPVPQLLAAFSAGFSDNLMAQEYLACFLSQTLAADVLEVVRDNIRVYHRGASQSLFELDESHRALLLHPFFSCYVQSPDTQAAMEFLLSSPALVRFFDSLYAQGRRYCFMAQALDPLSRLDEAQLSTLRSILDRLDPIPELPGSFMERWQENGGYGAELKDFHARASQLSPDALAQALDSRLTYVDLLYGNVLKGLPFEEIPYSAQNLLIHALANRQKTFLRMIAQHFDSFSQLPGYTVLFAPSFYSRICLNAMTPRDLDACQTAILDREGRATLALLEQRTYTFSELCLLSQSPTVYARFYKLLALDRVDDRLLALRQLLKHELLSDALSDQALEQLAVCLSQKSLFRWRDEDLQHISGITLQQCVELLMLPQEFRRFWSALRNASEAAFLIRQSERLAVYAAWSDVLADIEETDDAWRELKEALALDTDFVDKYRDHIIEFLMDDGAAVATTYARSLAKPEGYYRIVRAQLMGEYLTLKYYRDDLDREISYQISEAQKLEWCENLALRKDRFAVSERDDFFTTMRIGTAPQRTCLSYIDGAQRDCLLACFDSNKKILYATLNGRPVARAMLRLTKGCRKLGIKDDAKLEFADLRKAPAAAPRKLETDEELVLFMERCYTSGLNEDGIQSVKRMFAELVIDKAAKMNAKPALSHDYISVYSEFGMASMAYNIYISRSKAGVQYLDSLGGANSVSSEGNYKSGSFLMLPD